MLKNNTYSVFQSIKITTYSNFGNKKTAKFPIKNIVDSHEL